MTKSILITGGAGFIGSNLTHRLLAEGSRVCVLDDFSTGRECNLADLSGNPDFRLLRQSVTETVPGKYDVIYHLACPASPPAYQRDHLRTLDCCYLGARNVLETARRNNAVVLLASTSEVYGDPLLHPQSENYWGNVHTMGMRSCYDEGKRVSEALFHAAFLQHAARIKVVRIFNTYGPAMAPDDGRVVSNFIMQALCGEPLTVYGAGSQTRSFCFVDDLVSGLIAMAGTPDSFNGPVNLGNPAEFTVLELAELVVKLTGSASRIVYRKLPEDDPVKRCPDIGLARKMLNFEPRVSLGQGLRQTIEYFRKSAGTPA